MPPTDPKTVQIAKAELDRLIAENEQLRKQAEKTQPKPLELFGRGFASKTHDYEINIVQYETDPEGKLIPTETSTPEKPQYRFDQKMPRLVLNSISLRDFLSSRQSSFPVYIEGENK